MAVTDPEATQIGIVVGSTKEGAHLGQIANLSIGVDIVENLAMESTIVAN